MRKGTFFLVGLWVLAAGCTQAQKQGQLFCSFQSNQSQALAGQQAAQRLEARYGGCSEDVSACQRMTRISTSITRGIGWQGSLDCQILNSDDLNAFSLPPNKVYITRGLYRFLDDDDVLAAVIGHELAHIVEKDHSKPKPSSVADSLNRESRADCNARQYLLVSGYDSEAIEQAIELIRGEMPAGWADSRIAELERLGR